MRKWIWQAGFVIGAAVLAAWIGCRNQAGTEPSGGGKAGKGQTMAQTYRAGTKESKAESEPPKPAPPPEQPPPPKIPAVKISAEQLKSCLVKEGDQMPEAELADLEGKRASLRSLLGKKLTVVLFWNGENPYATQALEYLELDVARPFGEKGVRVVGINDKDPPEAARKAVEEAGAKYVKLLDPNGAYFAKVATDKKVPRVYLLDASGKVLWFDIEYSATTRRDLERAIKFVLGEK